MPSLQFLIDNMCANFTEQSMFTLVTTLLAQRPCTMADIALRITQKDPSLDLASAGDLAQAAVEALTQRGDVQTHGTTITLAGAVPR